MLQRIKLCRASTLANKYSTFLLQEKIFLLLLSSLYSFFSIFALMCVFLLQRE